MERPAACSQELWDKLTDSDKAFVIRHEQMHALYRAGYGDYIPLYKQRTHDDNSP